MESFDPVGGGFIIERITDFFRGSFASGEGVSAIASIVAFFRVIFIFFFFVFLIGILYVIYELRKFRPGYRLVFAAETARKKTNFAIRWKEILGRYKMGTESDMRLAVIEADSLVEEVFKKTGFEGESLGERIKNITPQELHSIDALKEAHALRNRLVHTPGYKISSQDALNLLCLPIEYK
jgi:hypothetical protein